MENKEINIRMKTLEEIRQREIPELYKKYTLKIKRGAASKTPNYMLNGDYIMLKSLAIIILNSLSLKVFDCGVFGIEWLHNKPFEIIHFTEASFRVPLIYSHTDWALIKIPELLLIKPADAHLYSVFGWFGIPKPYPERRTAALLQLKRIIEEKEL
jgi:hypothetical protein